VAVIGVVALALAAGWAGIVVHPWSRPPTGPNPRDVPIRHVVVLMMENRAFDDLFGAYCPNQGPFCPTAVNGIPPGTCVPYDPSDRALGCIAPYPFASNELPTDDPPHEWNSSHQAIDGGAMDGFYNAEHSGIVPFGYYNASTVPVYYDLAQEYGLGEDFFSSALSYSLPNHWYLLAGAAPPLSVNESALSSVTARHEYLNEANQTRTVQDLLNATPSVSWKYYDWVLPSYSTAINAHVGVVDASAYNYWSPLAARAESYTSWYDGHFVARDAFFADAASGQLPNISWVIPDFTFSDHPPADPASGMRYVASVVDALEAGPEWNSTALFLTWDDYGGFYDQVPPPLADPLGLSFRVPLVVVSPYTAPGTVVDDLGSFDSLLHFVEWKFGLGCLTPRDCGAPLPLGYFDFQHAPRAPVMFPTDPANATYPYVPSSTAALADEFTRSCGEFCIDPTEWDTGPPPASATVDDVD
jgi:phospholipase C